MSSNNESILVFGGAGYIGSHVVLHLCEEGYDVTVFDNLSTGLEINVDNRAKFIQGDILDQNDLSNIFQYNYGSVFHFAALKSAGESMLEPEKYATANIVGTINILNQMVKKEIQTFVFSSTAAVYGMPEYLPIDENHPLKPINFYGFTKFEIERLLQWYSDLKGIYFGALRYFNAYGPRQYMSNPYTGVMAIFLSRLKNDNAPVIYEDGLQTRDFVSVHDIVQANMLAMEKSEADYQTFNVASGNPVSIREIAEVTALLLGKDIAPDITQKFRKGDIRHCIGDISNIQKQLGFAPKVSFEDGLKEIIEWSHDAEAKDMFEDASKELRDKGLM